jgi:hypothetical protein
MAFVSWVPAWGMSATRPDFGGNMLGGEGGEVENCLGEVQQS